MSKVHGRASRPGITALQRVLIVLGIVVTLVVGAVAIAAIIVRAFHEDPRRPGRGLCTEQIERTPHAEYIERTCTRYGS